MAVHVHQTITLSWPTEQLKSYALPRMRCNQTYLNLAWPNQLKTKSEQVSRYPNRCFLSAKPLTSYLTRPSSLNNLVERSRGWRNQSLAVQMTYLKVEHAGTGFAVRAAAALARDLQEPGRCRRTRRLRLDRWRLFCSRKKDPVQATAFTIVQNPWIARTHRLINIFLWRRLDCRVVVMLLCSCEIF